MLSFFKKKFSSSSTSDTSDPEQGLLSGNIQHEHNEITSKHANDLMNDSRFSAIDDREKISIRDGILCDLNLFDDTNAIHLAQALQILLLVNKDLHGLLHFSEAHEVYNPFEIQRSSVDDFFVALAESARGPSYLSPTTYIVLSTGHSMDADTSKFCLICTCAVGIVCCTCWATAKSVEEVVNSRESSTLKGLKLTASSLLAIGVFASSHYYLGDILGEFLQGDENNTYADLEYGMGNWGIPVILGLSSLWTTNCVAAQLPCLPKTEIPIEQRVQDLIAYGEKQEKDLQKKLGETKANKLLEEVEASILPYFNTYPMSKSANNKLIQPQMILFAREVIITWISERAPKALRKLEANQLAPDRTYGTSQNMFQPKTLTKEENMDHPYEHKGYYNS